MQTLTYSFGNMWKIHVAEELEKFSINDFRVVLYLYKVGEANVTQTARELGMSYSTAYKTYYKLLYYRLVDQKRGDRTEILYTLTHRGKKVAEYLLKINEILEEVVKKYEELESK